MKTIRNFNLSIEKTAGRHSYAATVRSDAGSLLARNLFRYKIDGSIFTRLEDSVGKNVRANAKMLKEYGGDLFDMVFRGKVRRLYESRGDDFTRIKLGFNRKDADLLRVPWEFMFDGSHFLSAAPHMSMMRVLKGINGTGRQPLSGKLRMLAVISRPLDLPESHRLNLEKERMIILQAVARAYAADKIEIDFLDKASLRNIRERFYQKEYHILHLTSHGIYSKSDERCYLLLEDDFGGANRVDIDTIADLLAGHRSLRLVVLTGCQTAVAVGHRVLGDLPAPLLIKAIPAVVTMQYSVADQSAMDLARKFYYSVCDGAPVDQALANARRVLLSNRKEGPVDFGTPILYCEDPHCL